MSSDGEASLEGRRAWWDHAPDAAPVLAALLGAALQRALHSGVELGLLVLLGVTLLLPLVRRLLAPGRVTTPHVALAAVASLAGLSAALVYPLPLSVSAAVFLASVVVGGAVGVGLQRGDRLGPRDGLLLAVILGLNLAFRLVELSTASLRPYLDLRATLDGGAWRVLLPIDTGDGSWRWATTGLVLVSAIESVVGTRLTFLLFNVSLVVVAFAASWIALRARWFSFTAALCFALGTQYHYAYINSACLSEFLLTGYVLLNLLCVWMLATQESHPRRWRAAFLLSLWAAALCWEMWLDYAAFLLVGLALVWLRRPEPWVARRPAARFVGVALGLTLAVYLPCKMLLGGVAEHTQRGKEAEVVLTYFGALPLEDAATMAAEDVLVNALSYNHLALTNYLPPSLVYSPSLQHLDEGRIVAQHAGHGAAFLPELAPRLVLSNYESSWRFLAGALSLAFYYALVLAVRAWWRAPTAANGLLAGLLLVIAFGATTHLIIKFRYYNAIPWLPYKCIVAVTGVSLLVPFAAMRLAEGRRPERCRVALVILWLAITYGALVRPRYLGQVCQKMGLGNALPDPVANASALLERAASR
jgi:hypothetical protein